MPQQIDVIVEGLAFCYVKDGIWHVKFVCDHVHPLTLTPPTGDPINLRQNTQDMTCEFEGLFVAEASLPTFPNRGVPNLSAHYAHGGDVSVSNLVFERRHAWGVGTLTMALPHSTLIIPPGYLTSQDCYIQKVRRGGGETPVNLGRVAKRLVFRSFLVSDDLNQLTVSISHQTPPFRRSYPSQDMSGSLRFLFQNGCGNACIKNDSIDLYDIFMDKRGTSPEPQFVTGFLINGEVPGSDPDRHEAGGSHGNCDPNGSDPPPGD